MSRISQIFGRMLAAAGLVAVMVTGVLAGAASAAECMKTEKSGQASDGAQLAFRNDTANTLTIDFYRGTSLDGSPKKTQTIKPGKRAQFNYGMSGGSADVTGLALIQIDGVEALYCQFSVYNVPEKGSTAGSAIWKEGFCNYFTDCKDCVTKCEKKWQGDKERWRTTFHSSN